MDKQDKPRICEVLGVEANEVWRVTENDSAAYRINEDNILEFSMARSGKPHNWIVSDIYHLSDFIGSPDRIIRQPHFTDDELATMRVLYAVGARYIAKDSETMQWMTEKPEWNENIGMHRVPCGISHMLGYLPDDMFPSIRTGQSVTISDIIEEESK